MFRHFNPRCTRDRRALSPVTINLYLSHGSISHRRWRALHAAPWRITRSSAENVARVCITPLPRAGQETTNTQRFEANSLADEPVAGEPVSPGYSLFSPIMFGKTGNFPHFWIDLQSIFFQVLSTFPSVMVFSLRCKNCEHSSAKQGYFFNVSGTLDLITGANSTTAKATTAVFAASSANLAFGHAQGAPGRRP